MISLEKLNLNHVPATQEFTESTCSNFVAVLQALMSSGFRILWALRAAQQTAFQHLLLGC